MMSRASVVVGFSFLMPSGLFTERSARIWTFSQIFLFSPLFLLHAKSFLPKLLLLGDPIMRRKKVILLPYVTETSTVSLEIISEVSPFETFERREFCFGASRPQRTGT
jgi:hypothetical protein